MYHININKLKIFFLHLGLCWSMSKVTWFEAQTICKNKKQSLTLSTNKSSSFYWTGFYNRTSDWIKILGTVIYQ